MPRPSVYINEDINEIHNHELVSELHANYFDQLQRVFASEHCDIDPDFLGFVTTYRYLSELIPLHHTVLDIGCAFAPQGFYFRNHARYIGVDGFTPINDRFHFGNTEHIMSTSQEFFSHVKKLPRSTFVIANYMSASEHIVDEIKLKSHNCFVYYPQHQGGI
jgi:hypothetical protein